MGEQIILPGDPPIALELRPSARARQLSLRVSRLDGRVTLTLPHGASRRHALAFAETRAGWIRRHLAQRPDMAVPMPGGTLPFRGAEHEIVAGPGARYGSVRGGSRCPPAIPTARRRGSRRS